MAIKARWVGKRNPDGSPVEFHEGIPARDLDDEAWDGLSAEQKATISGSPLYTLRGEARAEGERAERSAAKGGD